MIAFVGLCAIVGVIIAIPVWILWQRLSTRRGLHAARGFNPDDAVPCVMEPVALNGRLMPELQTADADMQRDENGGAR